LQCSHWLLNPYLRNPPPELERVLPVVVQVVLGWVPV
jgi:hypothetical protein